MTTQFITEYNHGEQLGILTLPEYFHINYYNNKNHVYLINNNRVKRKVYLNRRRGTKEWILGGESWNNFIEVSGYWNINTLHFIKEGADTFYVTVYGADGRESGGYGKIHTRNRMVRCIGEVGNNQKLSPWFPEEFCQDDERNDFVIQFSGFEIHVVAKRGLIPGTVDRHGFQFNVHWNTVVRRANLMTTERIVLAKKSGIQITLMRFDDNGFQLTHKQHFPTRLAFFQGHDANESDERLLHGCNWDQYGEHLTEEVTFYQQLFPFVLDGGKLTIPSKFVSDNHLQQFEHAILMRMNSDRRVLMKFEHHRDKPLKDNNMNLRTNWKRLAEEWKFPMNKILRFKMVGTTTNPEFPVELFNGNIPLVHIFHVC